MLSKLVVPDLRRYAPPVVESCQREEALLVYSLDVRVRLVDYALASAQLAEQTLGLP